MSNEHKLQTRFRVNWLGQLIVQIQVESEGDSGAYFPIWRDAKLEDMSEMPFYPRPRDN